MNLITGDFETFYTKDYSLTHLSTEEYVTDPRFQVILLGLKINDEPAYFITGTKAFIAAELRKLNLANAAFLAHNNRFDGLILKHHFGITPARYLDTMQLANAVVRPYTGRVSLKVCLEHRFKGQLAKGDEVHNMIGRTRESLSRQELNTYGGYCVNDVETTYALFKDLAPVFPRTELRVADLTHRMYMDPVVELDAEKLARHLQHVKGQKEAILQKMAQSGITKDQLMSNDKFAEVLRAHGVEPPRKVSLKTGKETYAFSKTDNAFMELQSEYADDPFISAIIQARLGTRSTIEETRTERLLTIATTVKKLRVPLGYHKAHTGRYGGDEAINLQNLPRPKKGDKGSLRFCLRAPKGHVFLAADLSQIEARIVAWMARQNDLIDAFKKGRDVYSEFATIAYSAETVKGRSHEDDARRFVGKTCILGLGYGMGAPKLRTTLRKDKVIIPDKQAIHLVNTYRSVYDRIPMAWAYCKHMFPYIQSGVGQQAFGPVVTAKHGLILPNGMPLHYHNLRMEITENGEQWVYDYGREKRKIFGGKLFENIVQALARTIIMENMLKIEDELGLKPAMQVHDELDYIVPVGRVFECLNGVESIMRTPPTWAATLPVNVEVKTGETFGDCK